MIKLAVDVDVLVKIEVQVEVLEAVVIVAEL